MGKADDLHEQVLVDGDLATNTISGDLDFDDGGDGLAGVSISEPTIKAPNAGLTLTSAGEDIIWTLLESNGDVVTLEGMVGGELIAELSINTSSKQYSYTQHAAFDHPNTTKVGSQDVLKLSFTYVVTDQDGDQQSANIDINIQDQGPTASESQTQNIVEEGVIAGQLDFDLGADNSGGISSIEDPSGNVYSYDGEDIYRNDNIDAFSEGTSTLTLTPGNSNLDGQFIFEFGAVDMGAFEYTPSEAGGEELAFIYNVIDGDGDEAEGNLNIEAPLATGLNTLIVDGDLFIDDTFDLKELSDDFDNIEVVDLAEADFNVTISAKDVLDITDDSNTLQILGDVNDTVILEVKGNNDWMPQAPQDGFDIYSNVHGNTEVTLQIAQSIDI